MPGINKFHYHGKAAILPLKSKPFFFPMINCSDTLERLQLAKSAKCDWLEMQISMCLWGVIKEKRRFLTLASGACRGPGVKRFPQLWTSLEQPTSPVFTKIHRLQDSTFLLHLVRVRSGKNMELSGRCVQLAAQDVRKCDRPCLIWPPLCMDLFCYPWAGTGYQILASLPKISWESAGPWN